MFGFQPKTVLTAVLIILAVMIWRDWSMREVVHPPGVLVAEIPSQELVGGEPLTTIDDYHILPRAKFEIRARVLSREDYRWGTEADLSPMDLALGWGAMSDQTNLDQITVQQRSRWYFTHYEHPAPLSDQQIIQNSGNMHMIPSRPWLEKELRKIRTGDIVQLNGYLVDIETNSGWNWRTSLSRKDSGNGACEIVYLESVIIEERQ